MNEKCKYDPKGCSMYEPSKQYDYIMCRSNYVCIYVEFILRQYGSFEFYREEVEELETLPSVEDKL